MNKKPRTFARILRFRVEPRDFAELQVLAKRTRREPSILLRTALRAFLDREAPALE
jgi:predicted transcriptional regulator